MIKRLYGFPVICKKTRRISFGYRIFIVHIPVQYFFHACTGGCFGKKDAEEIVILHHITIAEADMILLDQGLFKNSGHDKSRCGNQVRPGLIGQFSPVIRRSEEDKIGTAIFINFHGTVCKVRHLLLRPVTLSSPRSQIKFFIHGHVDQIIRIHKADILTLCKIQSPVAGKPRSPVFLIGKNRDEPRKLFLAPVQDLKAPVRGRIVNQQDLHPSGERR